MAQPSSGLVQALVAIQLEEHKNDTEMAGQLGITRNYWSALKNGRKDPSLDLVKRVLDLYPTLGDLNMRDVLPRSVA